jgi:hypothetical protein
MIKALLVGIVSSTGQFAGNTPAPHSIIIGTCLENDPGQLEKKVQVGI